MGRQIEMTTRGESNNLEQMGVLLLQKVLRKRGSMNLEWLGWWPKKFRVKRKDKG